MFWAFCCCCSYPACWLVLVPLVSLLLCIVPKGEGSVEGEGEEGEEDHPCVGHTLCQPTGSGTEADSDGSHLPAQNGCHFNRGHQGKRDRNFLFSLCPKTHDFSLLRCPWQCCVLAGSWVCEMGVPGSPWSWTCESMRMTKGPVADFFV